MPKRSPGARMPASKPYRTTWKRPPPTSMNASAKKSSRNEKLAAAVASPSRPSGTNSGRDPLDLPAPGQQAFELGGLGAARDHALEHVGQPGQGLDPFSFAVATRLATIAQW